MGIIKYISTLFEREKWKSIFLTKTQTMKPACTSSRSSSRPQTHSSWMSNAHNATLSTIFSNAQKVCLCTNCKYLLAVPRGGKTKLAVGTAWRRKGNRARYIEFL